MFLHSGASLHGHEYSTTRSSTQPPPRPLPFLRSALRRTSDTDKTTPAMMPPPRHSVSRPVSYFDTAPPVRRPNRPRPMSEHMPRRDLSVRFREPETDDELVETPQSEDECSIACSDVSDLSDSSTAPGGKGRRKRSLRKSTQFLLAHPAPRLATKQRKLVQVRPRLLLQLQELSEKRPIPAFDILPSSLVLGSLIVPRLVKKCPCLFRTKPVLGLNDLLIVRSEDYGAPTSPGSLDTEDCIDQRDLISVISPLSQTGDDSAEIVMEDGSTWESSLMANGSYEFIGVDERGRISTARWVKKTSTPIFLHTRTASDGSFPASPGPSDAKWTFSMIHPDTRRHPIMGSMTSNTLDVFDTYNTMSTSSGRYPPTRNTPLDSKVATDWIVTGPPEIQSRLTKAVPEDIKLLMVATATWVNLRQGGWPATAVSRPPPTTLQRRISVNGVPARSQSFSIRNSLTGIPSLPSTPQPASPAGSLLDMATQDMAGRRRSMSTNAGFVRRFVTPRVSEEGRPPLEILNMGTEKLERPASRRMSVKQFANKIFRRRSNSQAQVEEALKQKLEY